jgi:hypothetical protein
MIVPLSDGPKLAPEPTRPAKVVFVPDPICEKSTVDVPHVGQEITVPVITIGDVPVYVLPPPEGL